MASQNQNNITYGTFIADEGWRRGTGIYFTSWAKLVLTAPARALAFLTVCWCPCRRQTMFRHVVSRTTLECIVMIYGLQSQEPNAFLTRYTIAVQTG